MTRDETAGELGRRSRAIAAINERIQARNAAVRTLEELCRAEEGGPTVEVVTIGFSAEFLDTAVMLCVPVAARGAFTRAERILLNGVPGVPGPAPNERLGVVDALIFAETRASASEHGEYDGAALILDLLRGKPVRVECLSVEGTHHERSVRLQEIEFARLYVYSIAIPAIPRMRASIGTGARIVVNGVDGIVAGSGSRAVTGSPALSVTADLHGMDLDLIVEEQGGSPHHTVALAMPTVDEEARSRLVRWARSEHGRASSGRSAQAAAAALAARIREGEFLLTGSDLEIRGIA